MEYLVSKIVDLVGEHAWAPVKRHLGYLLCYKRNIDNMEIKFGELDPIWEDVQRRVQAAFDERLEEVDSAVEAWLKKVKDADEEVKRIKDESTSDANDKKGCLHFRLHHRLGRQAAAQIQVIDDLVNKGKFDRMSHSPPPPSTTGSLLVNEKYAMFESRKLYINEILDALKDEAVHMIGVYGMGGIGKTTLVKEAANKAMEDGLFTEVVMVTVSQNFDLKRIQTGIAESLRLELKEDTVEVRADKIEERLMGKEGNRVLVILDDLWDMLELSKVRIPDGNNKGTCRVVITTRQEEVCNQMACQKKVELRTLSGEESRSLFNSRAEINVVESPAMKEVAWNVAEECDGLPLALVVLGTALKGKELKVWKTVLNQLKKSTMAVVLRGVSNKVCESIQLSYKFLESEEAKLCFLHCCLYPEDYDIKEKDLMHMLVGGELLEDVRCLHEARDRVHVLIDQLKASCLLHHVKGPQGKSCVRMHDVVRDVGIWIGERDHGFFVRAGQGLEEWPSNSTDVKKLQNCQRLSLMSNKILNLPSDPIECTKLETLMLHGNWKLSNIPEKFFQHMGALKVLDLSYTMISSLPGSLSCLTNLKVLNLADCCKLRDISPINGLKMLEILILKGAMRVSVIPETTGVLLNLRLVDLGKISTTSLLSYFSNVLRGCSRLEQLFISNYEGSLAELASLRFLTHLYIWGRAVDTNDSLSQDLGSSRIWTKLQEFLICFGPSLCQCYSFPEKGSRSLHLTSTKHFSPLLKVLLEKIDSLALVHCRESEVIFSKCDIPPHVSHNLTQLLVSDCPKLTSLGDELLFPNLKFMTVKNCPKLARLLPSKVWQSLHQLRRLEVRDCEAMLQLFSYDHRPMAMTELLPKLVYLKLSNLPHLESVLQPFQFLPKLMVFQIKECGLKFGLAYHHEMEMAEDPFPKLQSLEVNDCKTMLHLFPYDHKPLAMTELLPKLESLKLSKLPQLVSVLQQFQRLPNLMTLEISQCGLRCGLAYHEMEMVADPFPKLKNLDIKLCWEMSQMISSSYPDALQGMCIFQNLCDLTVYECPRLTHLFWSKQAKHMQQLTELKIYGCDSLTTVVISNDHKPMAMSELLPNLVELILCRLPQLESVLQPFQCLPNLMKLQISNCRLKFGLAYHHEMEMAADPFPNLSQLNIWRCLEMSQMISSSSPDALQGMRIFQNLCDLAVTGCPRLTHLFWSKQAKHMQQLTSLHIYGCDSLTAVVISNDHKSMAMTELLPNLVELILSDLPQLESVLQPFQCLPNLMKLQIEDCGLRCGLAYHHEIEMAADPFPNLERLYIRACREMSQMIISSSSLDAPLQGMRIFQNLCDLTVIRCPRLTHLFWSKQAKQMQQLTSLYIYACDSLTAVISNENQEEGASTSTSTSTSTTACIVVDQLGSHSFFPRLTLLILYELPNIIAFHQPSTALPMEWPYLETYEIEECPKLESPLLGSQMSQLKFMEIKKFPKLAMLLPSKMWQGMHQLKELKVADCMVMLQLFPYDHKPMDMTELFPKLVKLNLFKLAQLESVLQPFQCLPNLMELEIYKCGLRCGLAYHEMQMAADPFPKLKKLYINGCLEMSQMIICSSSPDAPLQGMCIFENLCDLTISTCPRLTHLFWSKQAKHMQQLTSLKISNCESLTAVVISNENQEDGAPTSTSTTATCMVVDHHGSHIFFPRLTLLILCVLPNIVAFHQPSTALAMEWPCLEEYRIVKCPKLETPLLGPQTSERISKIVIMGSHPNSPFYVSTVQGSEVVEMTPDGCSIC